MLKDYYIYPAVFHYISGKGISVDFPDLHGCFASGTIDDEAIEMATEALKFHLYLLEQNRDKIPTPSTSSEIMTNNGEIVVQIKAWMPSFREEMKKISVKNASTTSELPNIQFRKKMVQCLYFHKNKNYARI